MDYYEDDLEALSKAMIEAKKRFKEYLVEEYDADPAYYELRMKGVRLSSNFEPFKTVQMLDFTDKKGHTPSEGVE